MRAIAPAVWQTLNESARRIGKAYETVRKSVLRKKKRLPNGLWVARVHGLVVVGLGSLWLASSGERWPVARHAYSATEAAAILGRSEKAFRRMLERKLDYLRSIGVHAWTLRAGAGASNSEVCGHRRSGRPVVADIRIVVIELDELRGLISEALQCAHARREADEWVDASSAPFGRRTFLRLARERAFPVFRVGKKYVARRSDIEGYLERQMVSSEPPEEKLSERSETESNCPSIGAGTAPVAQETSMIREVRASPTGLLNFATYPSELLWQERQAARSSIVRMGTVRRANGGDAYASSMVPGPGSSWATFQQPARAARAQETAAHFTERFRAEGIVGSPQRGAKARTLRSVRALLRAHGAPGRHPLFRVRGGRPRDLSLRGGPRLRGRGGDFYHFVYVRATEEAFEYYAVDDTGRSRDAGRFTKGSRVDTALEGRSQPPPASP